MPLKTNQSKAIRIKLLSDITSTDEELVQYFVNEVNIAEKTAKEYIASRRVYQTHPAFQKDRDALPPSGFSGYKNVRGFSEFKDVMFQAKHIL